MIVAVLNTTSSRLSGEVRIFFFDDESVLSRESWPADQERLIESWGDALLGTYHTASDLLTVRAAGTDKWRNIYLPVE
jgi:hypothetical protein